MFEFSDQLAAGSNHLTNAVRGYAATGDKRYYEEFQQELKVDRNRDTAMEGLQKLGFTERENELLTRAKRNSDKLVSLENETFVAVENLSNYHSPLSSVPTVCSELHMPHKKFASACDHTAA